MSKHRVFVSIDIPEELKNVAEAGIEEFYKNNLARVGKKENWHITVVFCGDLTNEELERLKEKIKKIASETKKFDLVPDKIIFAPPYQSKHGTEQAPRKPRMVWLTFKYSPEFIKLSKEFSTFTDKNMLKPLPHSTLIRFKDFHYPKLKKLLPQEGINLEVKSFTIESINIMESHLSPQGSKFETICRNYLK